MFRDGNAKGVLPPSALHKAHSGISLGMDSIPWGGPLLNSRPVRQSSTPVGGLLPGPCLFKVIGYSYDEALLIKSFFGPGPPLAVQ